MSVITLNPVSTTNIVTLGVTDGRWYANGTDNPNGAIAWLKHSGSSSDITWQMGDTTAGQWLTTSNIFTSAQWDAYSAPLDADGFKAIELTVTPTWSVPAQHDAIDFQVSASSGWQMKIGAVASGRYELTANVPELSAPGLSMAIALFACIELITRGRKWSKAI
jgi:hypothetical protein